ncbi:MAG: DUF429 domain-containing protein [Aquificaceae bacterium]|nr:DUF429 domain-containing protein [Aquificaceae bacterium]
MWLQENKVYELTLGLDLAGSPTRPTGYAYMKSGLRMGLLYTDEEILKLARGFSYVFVDAPLSIPMGRSSLKERGPHFRECDLMLKRQGIRFFPLSLGPMRKLTERGIGLAEVLRGEGLEVFETFPGALYDILKVKRKERKAIVALYRELGLELEDRTYSQDELDAVACWLSGVCYLMGKAHIFSGKDGAIVVGSSHCFRT